LRTAARAEAAANQHEVSQNLERERKGPPIEARDDDFGNPVIEQTASRVVRERARTIAQLRERHDTQSKFPLARLDPISNDAVRAWTHAL
jgi:hypothetical protein